ncbi:hypothetical protein VNO78_19150 [Psophocarpus tetragonolobus]|uniref:Uncharacterized protein n=1 Tax=Psophocarpus tetragonolobus TaxID=3891 RepID=A0AAN9S976_PSOTE
MKHNNTGGGKVRSDIPSARSNRPIINHRHSSGHVNWYQCHLPKFNDSVPFSFFFLETLISSFTVSAHPPIPLLLPPERYCRVWAI